nr:CDGSH iron-sulfur domain-containing protein [candidate division Zixibacteria bacterium]
MSDEKSSEKPVIEAVKNASFKVSRLQNLYNSRGEKIPTKETFWLCRCGHSENKPFCDGRHKQVGFSDEKSDDRVAYHWKDYTGKEITVHDNRGLCSHSAECLKNLPAVFDNQRKPWVLPDAATVEKVIETIKKCPSGALGYSVTGEKYVAFGGEPAVHIARNGPLNVTGGIEYKDGDNNLPDTTDHYSLCRCGKSKNKPFCDGTHRIIHFRDDKN